MLSMHRGFTKLFNTIVTSTIWQEDDTTRIVWITMLAIADADGKVSAAIPGLASVANVTVEDCEKAVNKLKSPDSYSRTKDFDGRRIEETDGGWTILNYLKYRRMMSEEERREYKRIKQQEYRKRGQSVDKCSTSVDSGGSKWTKLTQAEAEGDKEAEKKEKKHKPASREEVLNFCKSIGLPESDGHYCWDKWEGNGFKNDGRAMNNWESTIRSWKRAGYLPSLKRGFGSSSFQKVRQHPDITNKIDPSKVDVPERFKSWAAENYPDKREQIMKYQTWADVPSSLRQEWWREEKAKLPL